MFLASKLRPFSSYYLFFPWPSGSSAMQDNLAASPPSKVTQTFNKISR